MDVIDKFMRHVSPEPMSGCWLWTGPTNDRRYGTFCHQNTKQMAHRFSFEHFVGAIPEGLVVDHKCNTTFCVNPGHLRAITIRANTLRGIGPTARNARKMVCERGGHPLVGKNIIWQKKGRTCRTCSNFLNNVRMRLRRARAAAEGRIEP